MKRLCSTRLACFASIGLGFVCAVPSPARAQGEPLSAAAAASPFCPQVEAEFSGTIDTKKVKAGELFRFTTDAPVAFEASVIPAGTSGIGLIATLDHSKSQGHSGYLVLEARYLTRADGSHVPVSLLPGGDGQAQAFVRAGSSSAGLIGYLPYYIGTAAGVYNTFHHRKDAAVVSGTHMRFIVGDAFYTGTCRVGIDQR
jgi:hypothetical protein